MEMQSLESQVGALAQDVYCLLDETPGNAEFIHFQPRGYKFMRLCVHFRVDAQRNIGPHPLFCSQRLNDLQFFQRLTVERAYAYFHGIHNLGITLTHSCKHYPSGFHAIDYTPLHLVAAHTVDAYATVLDYLTSRFSVLALME